MGFNARALHYVFRIANREASYKFFTQVLGMQVLRHEEFEQGCKATCNGPYDNMWSKTMVGYGSEDEHFVLELTYNYTVHNYELGNDFNGIYIESDAVLNRIESDGKKLPADDGFVELKDPDGHSFYVRGGTSDYPIKKVSMNVQDLHKSKEFYIRLLGMTVENTDEDKCILSYGKDQVPQDHQLPNDSNHIQCKVELNSLKDVKLERRAAFGRIAFAIPTEYLKTIEESIKAEDEHRIQEPLVSLDTPGKATVKVVILRDPDDHEICFVGNEGFRELSKIDPNANTAIQESMKKDESYKWT